MGQIDELWRFDGRRVVVQPVRVGYRRPQARRPRQLAELGAEVVGLDIRARGTEIR
jgi:hypothetical protein